MRLPGLLFCALFARHLFAQDLPPVVTPRGIVNADSQQPAPSVASPGGVIWIHGLNLGPSPELKAAGLPLPKQLGGIEVLVNDRPAALYSAGPERIVAQVPVNTPPGLAAVVVKRGEQRSRAARINIVASLPSVRTSGGKGFGPVLGETSAGTVNLTVTGLGATDPVLADGEASAGAVPRAPLRAYIGGWPANAVTQHTADQPGAFTVRVEVPAGASAADPVVLVQSGRRSSSTILGSLPKPEVQFMNLPDGTPELRTLLSADLRASFLAATGARAANGCFTGLMMDLAKNTSSKLPDCLAANAPNAATPFQQAIDGTALAAFIGPAKNQNEVSDRVLLLNAAKTEPMTVTLPATSQVLASGPEGNLAALLTGNQAVVIDANSGEVRNLEGGVGQLAGPGAGPGAGGLGLALPAVDLGDGLNKLLTAPVGVGAGTRLTVVGDHVDDPTKAKVAGLNAQNAVTLTRDFPAGWVPLAAPPPQFLGPNGQAQPLPAGLVRLSVTATFDAPGRSYYVLARRVDNSRHGLIAFRTDRADVSVLEFPEGSFVAACTPNIRFFGVELVRRIGILTANTADRAFNASCPASGFVLFDLDDQKLTSVPLPGAGQFSATQGSDEMNDYIFGSNTDPARQGTSDTLYVLDGVTGSPFRVDLPAGLTGFAQLRPVPAMNLLVGLARGRQQAGDAGLIVFDLDRGQGTVFPTPDGFAAVQIVDVFPVTRKVVARGTRPGNTGTQFLVYDLLSGDLQIVDNPAGVAFVGTPAAVPVPGMPGGGQPGGAAQTPSINLRANVRANSVLAFTYDSDRRQNGVLALRLN